MRPDSSAGRHEEHGCDISRCWQRTTMRERTIGKSRTRCARTDDTLTPAIAVALSSPTLCLIAATVSVHGCVHVSPSWRSLSRWPRQPSVAKRSTVVGTLPMARRCRFWFSRPRLGHLPDRFTLKLRHPDLASADRTDQPQKVTQVSSESGDRDPDWAGRFGRSLLFDHAHVCPAARHPSRASTARGMRFANPPFAMAGEQAIRKE